MNKTSATTEQELYSSNLSETRVETPSTYDTLSTSRPQQQSEHTYEPVGNLSETRVETPSTYDTLTTSQPQPERTYEPVGNLSETRVETPSTYDTLTTSQPQQQSEHTYEPVDREYYNVSSDPVKYENTQVNSTVDGSTGLTTGDSTKPQQQTSTESDYTEPYSHMPV